MSRDVLAIDLGTLIVQAEATAAQLRVTPRVAAALADRSATAGALEAALTEVAARARRIAIDRAIAEGDLTEVRRQGDDLVQAILAWRAGLRADLALLADACPYEVEATRLALGPRPRGVAAAAAWLAEVAPALTARAARVDATPGGAAVATALRAGEALAAQAAAAVEAERAAVATRAAAADAAREIRRDLQDRLRHARAGWTLARRLDPHVPALDLTLARAAAARQPGARRPDEAASPGPMEPPGALPALVCALPTDVTALPAAVIALLPAASALPPLARALPPTACALPTAVTALPTDVMAGS